MASWTLMNPPNWRSKDNTRPGMVSESASGSVENDYNTTAADELSKRNLEQPPLFLLISRASPTKVELSNAMTGSLMYTVEDTGRGRFSSKPDYEVWRPSTGNLLAGSIRVGMRGTSINLPLTGKKVDDVESYSSWRNDKLKWTTTMIGRKKSTADVDAYQSINDTGRAEMSPHWAAIVECHDEEPQQSINEDDARPPICSVKLVDSFPNGRMEIWTKDACIDIGGDWNVLDELVVVAYANMEKARRKLMMGPDPAKLGLTPLGMGFGVGAVAM